LSATAQGDIQQIIEDVVTKSQPVAMLEYKSEYEFVTGKSTINARLEMLPQDDDILERIMLQC